MDYKEAIEELESLHRHCSDMINEFNPDSVWRADCKALDMAISAMQELHEYKNKLEQVYGKCEGLLDKVINTLVQFADEVKIGNPIESLLLTDEEVELWKQIEKLGTLKEVRKAVEKQKPKKVSIEDVGYNQYRDVNLYACICPSCGLHIIEFDDDDVCESDSDNPAEMFRDCLVHHGYEGRNNYCNRCGQKLDWSEVDE